MDIPIFYEYLILINITSLNFFQNADVFKE